MRRLDDRLIVENSSHYDWPVLEFRNPIGLCESHKAFGTARGDTRSADALRRDR